MNYFQYKNNCRKIFEFYGKHEQKKQLIQECAELITALTKKDIDNIIEEMADVQVMLDEFFVCCPEISAKMRKIQNDKVNRQLNRIKATFS